jgi:hypothetical protein
VQTTGSGASRMSGQQHPCSDPVCRCQDDLSGGAVAGVVLGVVAVVLLALLAALFVAQRRRRRDTERTAALIAAVHAAGEGAEEAPRPTPLAKPSASASKERGSNTADTPEVRQMCVSPFHVAGSHVCLSGTWCWKPIAGSARLCLRYSPAGDSIQAGSKL